MKQTTECPAERAVYFLGGKWKIRILFNLSQKKKIRFGELKRILSSITQQMLSKQLKELENDGIINRKVHQIVPPKVEYSLTVFGLSLMPILKSLSRWNEKNNRVIKSKLNSNFDEARL
jgi:DNA-binding HxlR family transcriptional regulator